jgi:hypothetical protein
MPKEDYRPQQEATLQTSPERQPLPDVLDVLERGEQLGEIAIAWEGYPLKAGHRYTTMVSGL